MWSDLEMMIMMLCCIGLGFTIGVDWSGDKHKTKRH